MSPAQITGRRLREVLTAEEREDYQTARRKLGQDDAILVILDAMIATLRRAKYSRTEAMAAIGRADLIEGETE